MGKKGFNWKARRVVNAKVDNTETKKIKLDFKLNEYGADQDGNDLVLPSKKRKTKVKMIKEERVKILTKAQRKKYEKILDTKKKKENRAELLEALAKVQVKPEELDRLISITTAQTLGNRRLPELRSSDMELPAIEMNRNKKITSVLGSRKRKRLLLLSGNKSKIESRKDPNIVGLEQSESDISSSAESEEENDKNDVEVIAKPEESPQPEPAVEIDTEKMKNVDLNNVNAVPSEKRCTKNVPNLLQNGLKFDNIKTYHIDIERDPKIQVARSKLPILAEEHTVVECINENAIVILAGETGCGKTTQVPQFLYEAGYARDKMIGITEPRRVATFAMAARIGKEMGLTSRQVSYLMRFEGNVTEETKIKLMTDGVLLKEIQSDFVLSKYSVIIIDEAHERSVYTDILIGLLSRIVRLRKKRGVPLRLIIMSATLRVQDFTDNRRLFLVPPPVIKIESRQFPVTVHFNKRTPDSYMLEAFRKTIKIHTKLPEGGILVFVTGQQEVNLLVRRLRSAYPLRANTVPSKSSYEKDVKEGGKDLCETIDVQSDDDEVEKEMKRAIRLRKMGKPKTIALPKISLDDYDMHDDDGQADLIDDDVYSDDDLEALDGDSENDMLEKVVPSEVRACRRPLWVLPLYSMLAADKQSRVFQPPPTGTRLCIVSTDVAETSLTIPGIKYVVDTGKKKLRLYDRVTGASAFRVTWTTQAGADQRTGRAGRTSAGHCYRLYSSAVYQYEFEKFPSPDIHRKPIDDLVLQMKCMGIDKVINFPFPSPLDKLQLSAAEHRLTVLGALESLQSSYAFKKNASEQISTVTSLGRAISSFPVLPRYGKMLALSHQHSLLPYTVCMVAALSVPEVMIHHTYTPATGNSLLLGDPGVLLRTVGAAEFANSKNELESFCSKHGLREKAIREIRKLRVQITSEINISVAGVNLCVNPKMEPPSEKQSKLLRQVLLSGLGDQVAKKIGIDEVKQDQDRRKFKYAYHCGDMEDPVYMHSNSILRKTIPEWVVYQEVYEIQSDQIESKSKTIMRGVTAIEPEWLPLYVPNLCNLGDPLSDPAPRFNSTTGKVLCHVNATFGKAGWQLPTVEIDYPPRQDLCRWFAVFLLDGSICNKLRKYVKSLLSPPQTMVKSWARLHPRTESMFKDLMIKQISTREALFNEWEKQPRYLLETYLKWLPESAHNEVTLAWPPIG